MGRYPAVIGIIDPTRKAVRHCFSPHTFSNLCELRLQLQVFFNLQDKESWMKLCEKVSERCMIVGASVFHRPGLLKDEQLPDDFKTSAVLLRPEPMTTVTDLIRVTKMMEGTSDTDR